MKGLLKIPSKADLLKAYNGLQDSKHPIKPRQLIRWGQWVRFDPRLGEIIVEHLLGTWNQYNPIELNSCIKKSTWPAGFGVIIENLIIAYRSEHLDPELLPLLKHWAACAMSSIKRANNEQYYIGVSSFAGKQMKKDATQAIKPYLSWGYLGRDPMINKWQSEKVTLSHPETRRQVLMELVNSKQSFTVEDYLKMLNHSVSRRQAQRDLKNHLKLESSGFTKGRTYRGVS